MFASICFYRPDLIHLYSFQNNDYEKSDIHPIPLNPPENLFRKFPSFPPFSFFNNNWLLIIDYFLKKVNKIPDVGELMLASFPSTAEFSSSISPSNSWYYYYNNYYKYFYCFLHYPLFFLSFIPFFFLFHSRFLRFFVFFFSFSFILFILFTLYSVT